ncbi:uncharacterized protein LOC143451518 [Clavelina lepadiformis]|uniref:uncharacterized protein LOC143451518 n=1 Tax=Clavelina lepadiformis TaxID=159417 RepID=UPI004042DAFE
MFKVDKSDTVNIIGSLLLDELRLFHQDCKVELTQVNEKLDRLINTICKLSSHLHEPFLISTETDTTLTTNNTLGGNLPETGNIPTNNNDSKSILPGSEINEHITVKEEIYDSEDFNIVGCAQVSSDGNKFENKNVVESSCDAVVRQLNDSSSREITVDHHQSPGGSSVPVNSFLNVDIAENKNASPSQSCVVDTTTSHCNDLKSAKQDVKWPDLPQRNPKQRCTAKEVKKLRTKRCLKPFKCDVCGRLYSKPDSLKDHKMMHSNIKSHQCQVCGKLFSSNDRLERHVKRHSNIKPFQCNVCSKSFSQLGTFHSHLVATSHWS